MPCRHIIPPPQLLVYKGSSNLDDGDGCLDYLNINIVFIQDDDGEGHFNPCGNTILDFPDNNYNAYDYANGLVNKMNEMLENLGPLNLCNGWLFYDETSDWHDPDFVPPVGFVKPPKLKTEFRINLNETYFIKNDYLNINHSDNSITAANQLTSTGLDDKYHNGEAIELYCFPNHATGGSIKFPQILTVLGTAGPPHYNRRVALHEVFHALGLKHTWYYEHTCNQCDCPEYDAATTDEERITALENCANDPSFCPFYKENTTCTIENSSLGEKSDCTDVKRNKDNGQGRPPYDTFEDTYTNANCGGGIYKTMVDAYDAHKSKDAFFKFYHCDEPEEITNNIMDYAGFIPHQGLSQSQIDQIYFAINSYTSLQTYLAICLPPNQYDFTACFDDNLTAIYWKSRTMDASYDLYIKESAQDDSAYMEVELGTTETKYTFSGLSSCTSYDLKVITNCHNCESSDPVIFSFTTAGTDCEENESIGASVEGALDYCVGGSTNLTVTTSVPGDAYQYKWSINGIELTGTTSPNLFFDEQVPGVYQVIVEISDNSCGIEVIDEDMGLEKAITNPCKDYEEVFIVVHPLPDANIISSSSQICAGDQVTLTASGGNNYQWDTGEQTADITVSPSATAEYFVTVTDNNGCTDTESITISVNDSPTVNITINETSGNADDDGILCLGDEVTLTAPDNLTYLWSNANETTQSITLNPPLGLTTYQVTVTDINNCSATAEVTVDVGGISFIDAGDDQTICPDETVTLSASFVGTAPGLQWGKMGGDGTFDNESDLNTTYTPGPNDIENGGVTLFIKALPDEYNCEPLSDQMTIRIINFPEFTISEVPLINCDEKEIRLEATGGFVHYDWQIDNLPEGKNGQYYVNLKPKDLSGLNEFLVSAQYYDQVTETYCSVSQTVNVAGLALNTNNISATSPYLIDNNTIEIWDTDNIQADEVIVKSGSKLIIDDISVCFMKTSSYLKVEPGAVLEVRNAILKGDVCNEQHWEGVWVEGTKGISHPETDNPLNTNFPDHGLAVFDNSSIEDARVAIANIAMETSNGPEYSEAGGIIFAQNTRFVNNKKGIFIQSYDFGSSTKPDLSQIEDCEFINNRLFYGDNVQQSYDYINIHIMNLVGAPFTLKNEFVGNEFSKPYDVLTSFPPQPNNSITQTAFRINGSANISIGRLADDELSAKGNLFWRLDKGIDVYDVFSFSNIDIVENDFQLTQRNITLNATFSASITNNNFSLPKSEYDLNAGIEHDIYGIFLQNASSTNIQSNTIYGSETGNASHTYGIIANNVEHGGTIKDNYFGCGSTKTLNAAIAFEGKNTFSDIDCNQYDLAANADWLVKDAAGSIAELNETVSSGNIVGDCDIDDPTTFDPLTESWHDASYNGFHIFLNSVAYTIDPTLPPLAISSNENYIPALLAGSVDASCFL